MSSGAQILYHYCGTDSFVSMVKGRSLWLSSLKLSNDTMEGRLVTATLMRLAERDELEQGAMGRLKESIELMERLFEGLGFCLSEDGDLLSQWRGYADDARGVAIGFDRGYLDDLASKSGEASSPGFTIHRVEYRPDQHEADIEPTYRELRKLIDAGAFRLRGSWTLLETRTPEQIAEDDKKIEEAHRALILRLLFLFPKLYQLKAPAFQEEREWRMVSILTEDPNEPVEFRGAGARVVPYRSFDLKELAVPPIKEVVLGPRHETPASVIQSLLKKAGYGDVAVRRSAATYR